MNRSSLIGNFKIEGQLFRYGDFAPRFYNLCLSLGMEKGRILPSRAFCSDESQGYPIIVLTKHFGTFPFNHGRAGGVVSLDRHGPHASHSQDSVILQASHVGYDAENQTFGGYRRLQCTHHDSTPACGKMSLVIDWYRNEYKFAQKNIYVERCEDKFLITIDNQLLDDRRKEGIFLRLSRLITPNHNGDYPFVSTRSTSKTFIASPRLFTLLGAFDYPMGERQPIGKCLSPELFFFKKEIDDDLAGPSRLELNLFDAMHLIVASEFPLLMAAQFNTQVEFDRTFRTLVRDRDYRGKNLLYVSGLNIDISPKPGQVFPVTYFIPWAAYYQKFDGASGTLEQEELVARLREMSGENPDEIDMESAISTMRNMPDVDISLGNFADPISREDGILEMNVQ